jgi:hypothetical protein
MDKASGTQNRVVFFLSTQLRERKGETMIRIQSSLLVLALALAIASEANATVTVTYDHVMTTPASWAAPPFTQIPGLSSTDYLDTLTDPFTAVTGSTCHSAGAQFTNAGMAVLNNGAGSNVNDQTIIVGTDGDSSSYTRLLINLQNTVNVQQFNSYGQIGIDGTRNYQRYDLYGSNASDAPTATGDPVSNGWTLIANVATDNAWTPNLNDNGQTNGASVSGINQNFRYLLFDAHVEGVAVTDGTAYNGNHYVELDVVGSAVPEPGTIVLLTTGMLGLLAYAWRKRK